MFKLRGLTLVQVLPYLLLIGGAIGVLCAGILTYDKILVLEHPDTQLSCNINPIVACGPVINKPQASAFGFPNPFIGLAGFAIVATIGAAMLAGARFKRWFWLGLEVGGLFGAGFVTWLQFETIYRIHALCPYCMVTWLVTIPIFWYTTQYNLQTGNIKLSKRWQPVGKFVQRHHLDLLILWFLLILTAIGTHFWYYWRTVI